MSPFVGLVPILAIVTIQLLPRSVSSLNLTNEYLHHECINSQGKYKKGSPFEDNLNRVIRSVSTTSNFRDGFDDTAFGDGPNKVYARLQCRADSYWSKCRTCLATAIAGLRRRCPRNKGAIIWYDQCLLRISTIRVSGKIDYENKFYLSNPNKVNGNPVSFNKETSAFLENLAYKATDTKNVDGIALVLYASGEKTIGTTNLYAMVQCTKDLVFNSCLECLKWILEEFPTCCDGKVGGRVLSTSCNFRYELYPFLRT
ncbi:hypothetical protein EUTSA_v10022150mg [Eutrema salsugineum]|uniref:Gnk2-homologous domain-containing protein n=1 Tax=Eutrema salsugineum TaxID=72664 RepID=V4NM65_EUTSA|nr:cysteine-rich repeat secretory protein 42 [Eutrema salsugineum]ESQ47486.1 hypothetical protein EUTSA_v10022150mg [Eutrema salsugineum]